MGQVTRVYYSDVLVVKGGEVVVRLVCEDVKAITPNWSNVKEVVPITEPVD